MTDDHISFFQYLCKSQGLPDMQYTHHTFITFMCVLGLYKGGPGVLSYWRALSSSGNIPLGATKNAFPVVALPSIQAHLVRLCSALLHFTDAMVFSNFKLKARSSTSKKIMTHFSVILALLQWSDLTLQYL